tara:strand:+ start:8681 stop:11143 length:2463 start_codon:yes stop_codon:yes gene_type:complete
MRKNSLLFLFSILFASGGVFAQTEAERQEIIANYDLEKLSLLQSEMSEKQSLNLQKAIAKAELMGWEKTIDMPNGGVSVLIGLHENGSPKYYTTHNREGGITTRADKVHTGGGAGLDLNGEGMILGVWDGGRVRATHPLLENRVTQFDNPSDFSDHATHVSGTMIGTGDVVSGSAKGMAPFATIRAYDFFSDSGEMVGEAAGGLLVSNHSYGMNIANASLWQLGFYSNDAKGVDNILYNAPYYTTVWSAGNDRQSGVNTGDGGYDYLTDSGNSKNGITVAATLEVLNYTGPNSVNMSSFSSWGPTDDGRVKPDISAKGVNMYSSVGTAGYANFNGTSMSAPNVSGSLILLQQHYNNVNGAYMRSSTLRGLALHTADEAGSNLGPDYRFGWGLLNTESAAGVITNNGTSSTILEEEIETGEVYTYSVQADGTNDLMVSVTWLDPPGNTLPVGIEDNPTPSLINDLDLRVSQDGGATFMPWKLDVANFSAAATTGDNLVDNIEKVEIEGASGEYIIQVSHKGSALINGAQAFSLIVTGISNEQFTVSSHQGILEACTADGNADFNVDLGFSDSFSDTIDFTVSGLPAGTSGSFSSSSLSAEGTTVLTVDGIGSLAPGDYPFMVTGAGSSETINLYLILRILSTDVSDIGLIFPPDEAVDQPVVIEFTWESGDESVSSYDFELSRYSDFSVVEFSDNVLTPLYLALGVTEGATYYWRVKSNTTCAEGNFSEVYMLTVAGVLGVNDQSIEGLAIYPNPTKNLLKLSAMTPITNVKIVNVLGQVLISKTSNSTISQIDVSALSTGNYFISVTSENNTKVLQFLKK